MAKENNDNAVDSTSQEHKSSDNNAREKTQITRLNFNFFNEVSRCKEKLWSRDEGLRKALRFWIREQVSKELAKYLV